MAGVEHLLLLRQGVEIWNELHRGAASSQARDFRKRQSALDARDSTGPGRERYCP